MSAIDGVSIPDQPRLKFLDPSRLISAALSSKPSGDLLSLLSELDPWSLSAADQLNLVAALDRHSSWISALAAQALAAVAEPIPNESADAVDPFQVVDPVRDEVAAALRIAASTAAGRIAVARDLDSRLVGTARLLASGQLSYAQALVMHSECERLTDEQAQLAEAAVPGQSVHQTPGQLRRSVRRAAVRVSPLTVADEVGEDYARREVRMYPAGAVMVTIEATLPAPDGIAIWNALTACALADSPVGDQRTLDHKRADALTSWAFDAADKPGLPTHHRRRRLETHVAIDLPTLLGLADNPGELDGFGPIPAQVARCLAADSTWRRLVTDPVDGHLLDYGSTVYSPPAPLREYLLARDQTCRFPGCSQPAIRTDLDHTEAFSGDDKGGVTSASNLHCLCRRHHRLKTHHQWKVTAEPGARLRWTSPRGRSYKTDPPPIAESRAPLDLSRATPVEASFALRLVAGGCRLRS